jgi:Asp-tRNA(Asn)/Glu-tRNA(Gln) amidotransferase A subunit family amidase
MPNQDLCYMPAIELAAAIRARRLSPVELTTAILDRITQLNPKLNAYCTVVPEAALAAARQAEAAVMHGEPLGPLHGIPVSFKDLTVTAGIRTTFGSKIFEHHVPNEDAIVVERVRRAGAIVLGKTNTPEFGCKGGYRQSPIRLHAQPLAARQGRGRFERRGSRRAGGGPRSAGGGQRFGGFHSRSRQLLWCRGAQTQPRSGAPVS